MCIRDSPTTRSTKSRALPHDVNLVFLMCLLRYGAAAGAGCFPNHGKQPSLSAYLKHAQPLSLSSTFVGPARTSRVSISLLAMPWLLSSHLPRGDRPRPCSSVSAGSGALTPSRLISTRTFTGCPRVVTPPMTAPATAAVTSSTPMWPSPKSLCGPPAKTGRLPRMPKEMPQPTVPLSRMPKTIKAISKPSQDQRSQVLKQMKTKMASLTSRVLALPKSPSSATWSKLSSVGSTKRQKILQ